MKRDVAARTPEARGALVARALYQSWRPQAPALDLSPQELEVVAPRLLSSGASALLWRRPSVAEVPNPWAERFREAYRFHAIQDAVRRQQVAAVFAALSDAGVDGLLLKGWSVARLYPDPELRAHGDVDVCVRASDADRAWSMLADLQGEGCWVDLRSSVPELPHRPLDDLFAASERPVLDGAVVPVLCPEDQLAQLSIHFLRHGGWRPLWLCDIAIALEGRPVTFDWQRCLGGHPRRAGWIRAAVGLACSLLGADLGDSPACARPAALPGWLVRTVLASWDRPIASLQPPMSYRGSMASHLRHPSGALDGLRARWPHPIEATIAAGGPLNGVPRAPFQLQYAVMRAVRFIHSLPQSRART